MSRKTLSNTGLFTVPNTVTGGKLSSAITCIKIRLVCGDCYGEIKGRNLLGTEQSSVQ